MKRLKRYKYEHYAILCQLAYQSDTTDELDSSNYQQIELIDDSNKPCVRVVWQTNKKEVVVVFRGSHSTKDWLLNLCFVQTKQVFNDTSYKVHWGIANLLNRPCHIANQTEVTPLSDALFNILIPLIEQNKKITFIGHSTGGAMAVLFADKFERQFTKKTKRVVTFGQPSVGGRAFSKYYKLPQKTYRICCDIDMVTFLPPFPIWYVHVGKLLWLHDDVIYENMPSWQRLLLTLKSWLFGPISNHFMNKYIRHKSLFDEH